MTTESTFIPAFEGDWIYQSFLVLPTDEERAANPDAEVTAREWAKGEIYLADGVEFGAAGKLTLAPGAELGVLVTFKPGEDGQAAEFAATGTAAAGAIKGALYHLSGWAIPNPAGDLERVSGAVMAVRGTDANPAMDPGGAPVGTVGRFTLEKKPK